MWKTWPRNPQQNKQKTPGRQDLKTRYRTTKACNEGFTKQQRANGRCPKGTLQKKKQKIAQWNENIFRQYETDQDTDTNPTTPVEVNAAIKVTKK